MMDAVIKIGGRLGRGEHLRTLCEKVAELGQRHRLLIVPGGGAFADVVRQYDARFGLGDSAAHWMAILAMDQYGYLLADLIPGSTFVRSMGEAREVVETGSVPVLLPFGFLRQADALPHSWSVTSDSIAAWVAGLAEATLLVLLKDRRGLSSPVGGKGAPSSGAMTVDQLAAWEGVDDHLAPLLNGDRLDLWILNGERPDRLAELLETGWTDGIRLIRSDPSGVAPRRGPPGRPGGLPGRPPCAHP